MTGHARTMLSARAAKAYVAAVIAGIGSLAPVAGDGIELVELLVAAGVALAGFQATYWVSNAPDPDEPVPYRLVDPLE